MRWEGGEVVGELKFVETQVQISSGTTNLNLDL